jgi:C-terminal processing protease CtpA/Prc
MKRARITGIALLLTAALAVIWIESSRRLRSQQASLEPTIRSAVTNTVKFAKARLTGGIGAAMSSDPATGALVIRSVLSGSPAEDAGLEQGDVILEIDGVPTKGRLLKQNVDSIRGFTAAHVTLKIARNGTNTLERVIRRTSWNRLGMPDDQVP